MSKNWTASENFDSFHCKLTGIFPRIPKYFWDAGFRVLFFYVWLIDLILYVSVNTFSGMSG